jgi:tetratricopeptide (TPR) repeat protein
MIKCSLFSILFLIASCTLAQTKLKNSLDSFNRYSGYQFPDKETLNIIVRTASFVINDAIKNKKLLDIEILKGRGKAYENLRMYDQAILDYSKVIELAPSNFWNYFTRAEIYEKMLKNELAALDYVHVIDLNNKEKVPDDFYAETAFAALKKVSPEKANQLINTKDPRPLYLKYYDSAYDQYKNVSITDNKLALKLIANSRSAYRSSAGIHLAKLDLLEARLYKKAGKYGDAQNGAIFYYHYFLEHAMGNMVEKSGFELVELADTYKKAGMKNEALKTYQQAYKEADLTETKESIKKEWDDAIAYFKTK